MEELVDKILDFDRRVRYCAVIDRAGERITDRMRSGIIPLDPPEMWVDALRRRALTFGVYETLAPHYGPTLCIIGIHEKVIVMICPVEKYLLVATLEKTMPHDKIQELHKLIQDYSSANL